MLYYITYKIHYYYEYKYTYLYASILSKHTSTKQTKPQKTMNNQAHPNDADSCLICLENIIDNNWCVCIRCKIQLHNTCEQQYRGKKGHTECPHCRRIGTMGVVKT